METIEKIKDYLFGTAEAGENITETYLRQTIGFISKLEEELKKEKPKESKKCDLLKCVAPHCPYVLNEEIESH
jgi:hypothetical protein